jgi:hypothetical protein
MLDLILVAFLDITPVYVILMGAILGVIIQSLGKRQEREGKNLD